MKIHVGKRRYFQCRLMMKQKNNVNGNESTSIRTLNRDSPFNAAVCKVRKNSGLWHPWLNKTWKKCCTIKMSAKWWPALVYWRKDFQSFKESLLPGKFLSFPFLYLPVDGQRKWLSHHYGKLIWRRKSNNQVINFLSTINLNCHWIR